jgi:hypothetical protein
MSNFYKYDQNPWMVEQLEDFLFFCCPECDEKCRTKDIFLQHALCHHPSVSIFFNILGILWEYFGSALGILWGYIAI